MKKILPLVFFGLFLVACLKKGEETSYVVKVNDYVLTKDEINKNIPKGLTAEDSTIAAEYYIRNWVTDNLKYEIAAKNRVNKELIEQLVQDYRKSLTIYQYEEQLINEKLSKDVDNQALLNYYEANKDKFKTDKPLIKGLFLKIPINAPQIEKVRNWYKSLNANNIYNIENYCVKNGATYGYYVDKWISLDEVMENLPNSLRTEFEAIKQVKDIEKQDDNYYYFLHVNAYLLPGDNAPFEYAKLNVKEILINQQKINFLKKVEEDLYNKALNNGQISFYE